MADNSINVPGGFGGLVHYNEQYESKFMVKPIHVLIFVLLILGLRIALPFFISIGS